jgi:hypothetical protein
MWLPAGVTQRVFAIRSIFKHHFDEGVDQIPPCEIERAHPIIRFLERICTTIKQYFRDCKETHCPIVIIGGFGDF